MKLKGYYIGNYAITIDNDHVDIHGNPVYKVLVLKDGKWASSMSADNLDKAERYFNKYIKTIQNISKEMENSK